MYLTSSQHLFLFSDGQDSNFYSITTFCSKINNDMHIAVSSFGIGAHFDEKLMLKIAELGGGFCI